VHDACDDNADEAPVTAWSDPKELKTAPPFSTLFDVDPDLVDSLARSMEENGFDPMFPILVHQETDLVLDGGTRRAAAIKAGLASVPVRFKSIPNIDDATIYAIRIQSNRRNLSAKEILKAIKTVDRIKAKGGDHCSEKAMLSRDNIAPERSSAATAKIVGVSEATVNRARVVLKDPVATQAVMEGKASINMAARDAKAKNPPKPRSTSKAALSAAPVAIAVEPLPMPLPSIVESVPIPVHSPGVAKQYPRNSEDGTQAVKPRYDSQQYAMDVRIYEAAKPLFDQLRDLLEQVTGVRGSNVYGQLYQAAHALANVVEPGLWLECRACKGTGFSGTGYCGRCRMGKYQIPNL